MNVPGYWPILGICGYSGSGKTTLIETLIPLLRERGLTLAVVKHDSHHLSLDHPGKDSDRFFQAGATVLAHDPTQGALRWSAGSIGDLGDVLRWLLSRHDLVIVEGHKETPLPVRVWLHCDDREGPPDTAAPFLMTLGRQERRVEAVTDLLAEHLQIWLHKRPLRGGILVGGRSLRMGRPKHLMDHGGLSWVERAAAALAGHVHGTCLLGEGEIPDSLAGLTRLVDAPGFRGPVAGILAAMRWDPEAAWVILPADMPLMTGQGIEWLLKQRSPGRWGILPQREGAPWCEPLGAWYDSRTAAFLERCDRPQAMATHTRVARVPLPAALTDCWRDCDDPQSAASLAAGDQCGE